MAKFAKPFRGVPDGEIYAVDYEAGADCPPELEAAAKEADALEGPKPRKAKGEE